MKKFVRNFSASVAAVTLATTTILYVPSTMAANQGTLGSTSTGDLDISVTKANQAQITSLADFTTAAWSITNGAINHNDTVCVYSSNGTYTIKGNSLNAAAGAFRLENGGNFVVYTVTWNDGGVGAIGTIGATVLTENVATATLSNAATDSATCGVSGNTARIDIDITAAAMIAVPAAAYTDTLTLLVTPV